MVSRNMVLSFPSSVEKLRLEINLLPFAINQLIAELVVREPLVQQEKGLQPFIGLQLLYSLVEDDLDRTI